MKRTISAFLAISVLAIAGCVTSGTHEQTVAELEQSRKASSKMAADFDNFKKQSAAQIAALEADKTNSRTICLPRKQPLRKFNATSIRQGAV